jgi:tetratricopeptide (TPR) repeat protein
LAGGLHQEGVSEERRRDAVKSDNVSKKKRKRNVQIHKYRLIAEEFDRLLGFFIYLCHGKITIPHMKKALLTISLLIGGMLAASAQTYEELANHAIEAAGKDSLALSEQLFEQALKLDPSNIRNSMLLSNLGTVQRRLGKNEKAIDSYTLALNLAPYSVTILMNRADLYLDMNYWDKAYIDYCNVIDIDPKHLDAHLFRAYINMQRRSYQEARTDYKVILEEKPGHKTALIGLAYLDQKELRYRDALEGFTRLITDYPEDASLWKARANLEIEMNTLDLALLDLEKAASLAPNDAEVYVTCGEVYLAQKRRREAYVAFEKAISLGASRADLQDKMKQAKK